MSHRPHIITLVLLPLATMVVGWQLGMRYEERMLHTTAEKLEMLYGGQAQSGATITDPQKQVDISLMWGVWKLLLSHYVRPQELDTQKMVYGAVRGMVASVGDPYTLFMTPKENTDFRDTLNGHLEGIGAQLTLKNGVVVVVTALKGSPAEKAGLLAKDNIVTVDGKTLTSEMSLDEIVGLIRGKKGTSVTLGVQRGTEAKPRSFTIVRDTIQVPSTQYDVQQTATGSLGLLTINEFGAHTIAEVSEILKQVKSADLKGLIVDLRYNGGGYLDGAVNLSSMFLREGTVVTVDGRDGDDAVHTVSGQPVLPDIPMVILINQGTASASEIFAGAMKDHGRAKIIGMQSFGKGTVQEVIDLPGGSSLRVTIARWLTPNGTDLGKVGITPDIVVDRTEEDIVAGRDPEMTAAQEWLLAHRDVTGGRKPATATGSTR